VLRNRQRSLSVIRHNVVLLLEAQISAMYIDSGSLMNVGLMTNPIEWLLYIAGHEVVRATCPNVTFCYNGSV